MKVSIMDFSSKCDQIRRFLRIWSHLLTKLLTENFFFCAVIRPKVTSYNYTFFTSYRYTFFTWFQVFLCLNMNDPNPSGLVFTLSPPSTRDSVIITLSDI